jgi:hypothetical protein
MNGATAVVDRSINRFKSSRMIRIPPVATFSDRGPKWHGRGNRKGFYSQQPQPARTAAKVDGWYVDSECMSFCLGAIWGQY